MKRTLYIIAVVILWVAIIITLVDLFKVETLGMLISFCELILSMYLPEWFYWALLICAVGLWFIQDWAMERDPF